jgi:hypothetical protein
MTDSLTDRDPITEVICHFREALKGGECMALSTVLFCADETSMLAPDGWIWQRVKAREANRDDYLVGVPDIAILLYSAPARLGRQLLQNTHVFKIWDSEPVAGSSSQKIRICFY